MIATKKILSIVVLSVMSLNVYIATLPNAPRWIIVIFGAAAIVAQIVKDQMVDSQVEGAVTDAVSKTT